MCEFMSLTGITRFCLRISSVLFPSQKYVIPLKPIAVVQTKQPLFVCSSPFCPKCLNKSNQSGQYWTAGSMLPEEGGVPSAALDCVPVLAGGRRGVQLCSSCERCVHAPAGLPRIFSYPSHGRTLKTRAGSLYQHTVIRKELKTAVKIHNIKLTIKCFKVALSCNCHHHPPPKISIISNRNSGSVSPSPFPPPPSLW